MDRPWTPVALSADLPQATVLPAYFAGGSIALWRSASGQPAACADRCPHRGMRLSHGFVRGETLACIYHGWRYGRDGTCRHIPAHPGLTPPETIRVADFQVTEQDGLIWVSADAPQSPPPRFPGHVGLRSLTLAASPAQTCTAMTGSADMPLFIPLDDSCGPLTLLLAPAPDNQTLMHLLVPADSPQDRQIAASRKGEHLRRLVESAADQGLVSLSTSPLTAGGSRP